MKIIIQIGFALGISALACASAALGQDYPSRTVTIVAPYAAGGGNDILARVVGKGLAEVLKQPVVIENKTGASGTIGLNYAARAKPDGYTIVLAGIGSIVLRPAFDGDKSAFDPQKELRPVALIAKGAPVLMINSSLNVKNLAEFVALARTSRLTYGTPGTGSAMHLTGELMRQVVDVPLTHIPYRGQSSAMTDLLSGTISFVFTDVSVALPYAQDERLKIIAVAGRERAPQLPDVPTTAELGYPKLVMENWYAFYAPLDTPTPIVTKLSEAIQKAMALPEVRQMIGKTTGLIPLAEGPAGLQKQTDDDIAVWRPVAARAKVN